MNKFFASGYSLCSRHLAKLFDEDYMRYITCPAKLIIMYQSIEFSVGLDSPIFVVKDFSFLIVHIVAQQL